MLRYKRLSCFMMQEPLHHHSYSASDTLFCSSPIFKIKLSNQTPKMSPDYSPSMYKISNCALDNNPNNYFFNSNVPLKELQNLSKVDSIIEESDDEPLNSKSSLPKTSKSVSKLNFQTTLKPNSRPSQPQFVPITVLPIKLKNPPARPSDKKRKQRGDFDNELISFNQYKGKLKFYNFNTRFGFVSVENEQFDTFLCEDELVLSNQNLKKFKDEVYKKKPITLEFNIKKYINPQGKEMRKAVNIEVFYQE